MVNLGISLASFIFQQPLLHEGTGKPIYGIL